MQSKLPNIATNIFSVMSALAKEHHAINLSQGFPDYPIAEQLVELVYKAMKDGYNQYAPMPGWPVLRDVLAHKIADLYNTSISAEEEITITPGATYSIYTSLATILHPGDEVIVLEPAYDSYIPNIESMQAKAICVPLQFPDFSVNWEAIKQVLSAKTKAIIINTPHNPCGYVWTKEDMLQLQDLVRDRMMYVISDEVYEHITLDGRKHESVLMYPELFQKSFVTFSFGKVFHTTGWKLGYCVAPKPLSAEFRKMHQFLSFSCNTPMQVALAEYLQQKETYLQLPHFFQKKRDLFLDLMKPLPFTLFAPTQGSYFQLMGFKEIKDCSDKEFAIWMTKEIGVATIPVSAFYRHGKDDQVIRFCFAKQDETLEQAAARMQQLL